MKKEYDFSKGERGKFYNADGELSKTTRYDVTEYLRTPEEINAYLEACIDEANGDEELISKAKANAKRAETHTKHSDLHPKP